MESTIKLLLSKGYNRLTTADIAVEAGVSRGALTHHFESKEDIVAASIKHQLEGAIAKINSFSVRINPPETTLDDLIDFLWDLMSDGLYYVTLEYLPETRHNDEFRRKIGPTAKEFHRSLNEVWESVSLPLGLDPETASVMLNATMCFIRGMMAQTVFRNDAAYFEEMISFWKKKVSPRGR